MLQDGEREHERTAREQVVAEVQDSCDVLQHKLTAFESAWHIVRLACSRLSSDLALAKSFTTVRHEMRILRDKFQSEQFKRVSQSQAAGKHIRRLVELAEMHSR